MTLPGIPMDVFINKYPQALRDWIEQDLGWKVNDLYDILIEDGVTPFTKVYATKKTEEEHKTAITEFYVSLDDESWKRKIDASYNH